LIVTVVDIIVNRSKIFNVSTRFLTVLLQH